MRTWKNIVAALGIASMSVGCGSDEDGGAVDLTDFRSAGEFCAGKIGLECTGNFVCVDDPSDNCDPNLGGADCAGICLPAGGPPECKLKPQQCAADCVLDKACPQKCHCPGGGTACGDDICMPKEICCDGIPFPEPTCYSGDYCPKSKREFKTDIRYLQGAELNTLHRDLMQHKVATYRYKEDGMGGPSHLGFIIDDVAPSPSVGVSGERVNMYGYTTMAVAAVQVQQARIENLERELAEIKQRLEERPAKVITPRK